MVPGRLDLSKLVPLNVTIMQSSDLPSEPFYVVWPDTEADNRSCEYCEGECNGYCEDLGW
jgi:hypothetical protein